MLGFIYLLLLLFLSLANADDFTPLGCFKESDILSLLLNQGAYTYQSTSYCENLCEGDKVAALLDGKYCYCGSTVPLTSLEVDDSNCDTACQGYGSQTCGGDGYFYVYVNEDVLGSTMLSNSPLSLSSTLSLSSLVLTRSATTSSISLSSSKSSSSSSSPSSSSLSLSGTSSATSTDSTSSSSTSAQDQATTLVSTVTLNESGSSSASVIEVTTTVGSLSLSTASATNKLSSSSSSLSGGAIAGVVIGALAGVALIAGLIFLFIWWRRRRAEEEENDESFFDNKKNGFDSVAPNPLITRGTGMAGVVAGGAHAHNNSITTRSYSTNEDGFIIESGNDDYMHQPNEEEYGRRRLSNGSLPDMANRNITPLKVVNY